MHGISGKGVNIFMNKVSEGRDIWKVVLWVTGMLILVIAASSWYWVVNFDTEKEVVDNSSSASVYFADHETNENNDSWETVLKVSENPFREEVFTGMTCPGWIVNDNSFEIKDWTLRFDIVQECYLNGFWCGDFEVHQFRDGQELVNTVVSKDEDLQTLNIDYNKYSDTPMVHLIPGDYLVYIPSESAKENAINGGESVGIGYIFYFHDRMDLSNWTLSYNNNLKLIDLIWFKILLVAVGLWIVAVIVYFIVRSMTRKIKNQLNEKIRNISIMADLYLEAYIIDIEDDSAQLIKGEDKKKIWNLPVNNIQSAIYETVKKNCQDIYQEDLVNFLDLKTVMQRMGDSSSITFEYYDEVIGWYAIRIFKAGSINRKNQIVLTLQDINEEKKTLSAIEDRMNLAEYKQNVSGSFLETVSFALNDIAAKVNEAGKTIYQESSQEEIKALADQVVCNTRHMNLIQNTMIDLYAIECKKLRLNLHPYNVREMIGEIKHILEPFSFGRDYEFSMEVDDSLPEMLIGDSDRIEQILVILLFSSMLMTQKGFVKFTLFGKQHGNKEEMIFSLRDSANGFTEVQLNEIHEFINGSNVETFDNASLVYLKIINGILTYMNSELKIVSVVNEGTDFYFTVTQDILEQ